jgi:hypothetical protein
MKKGGGNMVKVDFTSENAINCICGRCPVQMKSKCSDEKWSKAEKELKNKKTPKAKEVPALYCSAGTAACKDLSMNEMCICGDCPIFMDNALERGKPVAYYCRDGKAK